MKTPQQKIAELEQKVRLLERQNAFLQKEVEDATDKAGILDMIIKIAEEELKVLLRKNRPPSSRKVLQRANKTDRRSLPAGRGLTPEVLPRQVERKMQSGQGRRGRIARAGYPAHYAAHKCT